jgi:hypothetical protein
MQKFEKINSGSPQEHRPVQMTREILIVVHLPIAQPELNRLVFTSAAELADIFVARCVPRVSNIKQNHF